MTTGETPEREPGAHVQGEACRTADGAAGRIVAVVPAYNEAHTIVDVVGRILAVVDDVVVVDDGSADGTADLVSGLPVRVVRHDANRGKGASLMTGFRAALDLGADAVVTLDGDGQHPPEHIPRLVERAGAAGDRIVIGTRLHDRAAFPPARYRANRIADFWVSWASGQVVEDSQSGFRLYPRRVLETMSAKHGRRRGFVFETEVLIDAAARGCRSVGVPVPALYAGYTRRPSHFRPVRDITAIVLMVAGKLLSRGMHPRGLIGMLRERRAGGGRNPVETTHPPS